MGHVSENPYLLGVYAPVHAELTADGLEVVGEVPRDLNGVYLRNGPNPRFPPVGRYHWFDGDAMVHAVHFDDGAVRYTNRFVRTAAYQAEAEAGRGLWTGVIEPPAGNPPGNARGLPLKDSANTDLTFHRGAVLATWYLCGTPYRLDPLTLDTLGPETFGGTVAGDVMAHAKVDERTGELFWFDYGPARPWLRYGVTGAGGTVSHLVHVDLPGPRLPHDMAITDRYAVLMDLPLVADPEAARQGRHRIIFDRELPARFGVIPRRGQAHEVRWFEASPCYIYHVVNAWERASTMRTSVARDEEEMREADELILDVCRVAGPQPRGDGDKLNRMLSYLQLDARLWRYRFNLATGAVTEEQRDDANTDFPSIDTRRTGQPTRYSYNVSVAGTDTLAFDGLIRYDLETGSADSYRYGPGRFGSEAPFAPRDGSVTDDDGYLVTFVTGEADGRSEVQILHAAAVADGPVARILLPQRVPLGFHACWVRADQLPA